ncbi:TPA: zf-HC2 domain-containing protein, partial [Mannheimia haemolytica]|nr:zf-HC2 domain-containing protein [Mannheimia haemolytica]
MKCRQATELISQSCDEKLRLQQHMRLQLHLLVCPKCRNFNKNTKKLGKILRAYCN